jgi:hypothetical protein
MAAFMWRRMRAPFQKPAEEQRSSEAVSNNPAPSAAAPPFFAPP